jgi:hypothetical protein
MFPKTIHNATLISLNDYGATYKLGQQELAVVKHDNKYDAYFDDQELPVATTFSVDEMVGVLEDLLELYVA